MLGEAYGPVVLKPKGGTWRSRKEEGGGALYDYAAHPLNLLNWYLGEPAGVGGTVLNSIFSREIDDEVHSTLYYEGGRSARISVNWSDESYRKMTTRITIWGTTGRIFADRQEVQVYLRDTATVPDGYQHGWNVRYTTELTEPVGFYLRGEEYSAQIDHFVARVRDGRVDGINAFDTAAETDRVIAMMIARRPARRPDRRQRRRRRRAGAGARQAPPPPAAPAAGRPAGAAIRRPARNAKGILMDRLLFGDNQFFGVNHMSEEKARAQSMRFQSLDAVIDVLDSAYDAGVRTFMCTTHDRVAQICDHVRAQPERYADFTFYPCMPYAHKYANAVTEDGMLGALKRFLPDEGLFDAAIRGGSSMAKKDIEGVTTLLIDAEMKMFEGLRTPVVFLQNVVVDLLLGLGFKDVFRIFADHVSARYDAEPGFITMNLPALLPVLEQQGIENPIVCSNINKIGFRMCGGLEAYERALRERRVPRDRDVGVRLGRDPAGGGDRVGLRAAERRSRSCSAPRARATSAHTRDLVARHWELEPQLAGVAQLTTLLVASTGGHLKQLHRLHRRLVAIDGPYRWATFDTPQSRSLLEGEAVDFVHFVGGRDPGNVLRNVPLAERDPAPPRGRHDRQHRLGDGAAVLRAGSGARPDCHYIESAARSDGPSKTAGMISRIPGVNLYAQYPAWADGQVALPRRGVRLVRARRGPARATRRAAQGGRLAGDVQGHTGSSGWSRRLLEILPAEAEVLWQTGDTDVSGFGIVGHHAIPERELTDGDP